MFLFLLNEYKHTSFYCAKQMLLHFTGNIFCFCFIFYKLKGCDNSALNKSVGPIFPTFAHSVSLYHILVILEIIQTFSLLSNLLGCSVISDSESLTAPIMALIF